MTSIDETRKINQNALSHAQSDALKLSEHLALFARSWLREHCTFEPEDGAPRGQLTGVWTITEAELKIATSPFSKMVERIFFAMKKYADRQNLTFICPVTCDIDKQGIYITIQVHVHVKGWPDYQRNTVKVGEDD
jgi:hypothetical protein